MKASELIATLSLFVHLHGDVDVALVDVEGETVPLEPQVMYDTRTNAIGINSDIFDQADGWAGKKEWEPEDWADFVYEGRMENFCIPEEAYADTVSSKNVYLPKTILAKGEQ